MLNVYTGSALLAVGGVLWWWTRRPPEEAHDHEGDEAQGAGGGVMFGKGIRTANSGIKLNARQIAWIQRLRAECSSEIVPELVITSGIRDEYAQARAMIAYATRYGWDSATRTAEGIRDGKDLRSLYGAAVAAALRAIGTMDDQDWGPIVRGLYDRGLLRKSGHYTGGAIDVRGDESEAAGREIIRAALAAGARKAYDDGPAIHVDLP